MMIVVDGGRLGIHSCSRAGIKDDLCNDTVAQNALGHGVDYGSVMAFMHYVPPNDIAWFGSTDVDCWGISRWPKSFHRGTQPGEIAPCVKTALGNALKKHQSK